MSKFGIKYAGLVGCIMLFFANFVACGAQLYNVSLKDDTSPHSIPASASDPTSYHYGLHAPKGWRHLPIHFRTDISLAPDQQQGLVRAMQTWEIAVGKKLFVYEGVHEGVTGDSFKDLYSSLNDMINGHYLDEYWGKTGKPEVVLATTIWDNEPGDGSAIKTADIRFNSNHYALGDSLVISNEDGREVVDMQTLALHELGHLLGLAHVSSAIDAVSIMGASLYIGEGLTNRRLSQGDVERIQKIYGCEADACDSKQVLAKIEALDRRPVKRRPTAVSFDNAH